MRKFEFVGRVVKSKEEETTCMKLPERSTAKSAGYDFFALTDTVCKAGEITLVLTGVKATFPEDEMLMLVNRSSNPRKKGLEVANGVGIIDSDYYNNPDNEGEIGILFKNTKDEDVVIKAGDKMVQGIFVKYGVTEDDKAVGERSGGFGSTGK